MRTDDSVQKTDSRSVSELSLRKCVSEERISEAGQLEGLIHIGVGGESKLLGARF
jgi:hypothetical protein